MATDLEKLINLSLLTHYDEKLKDFLTSNYTKLSDFQSLTGFEVSVVSTLPATGVKGTIYFVPKSTSQTSNVYDEYLWLTDKFEKIGDTEIDLSGYATTLDISSSDATANGVTTTTYTEKLQNGSTDLVTKTFSAVTSIGTVSTTVNGLMTSTDKTNLDNLVSNTAGYQVATAADAKYVTAVSGSVTNGTGYALKQTINGTETQVGTIGLASATADGLMALGDKSKVDSIGLATTSEIDALFPSAS